MLRAVGSYSDSAPPGRLTLQEQLAIIYSFLYIKVTPWGITKSVFLQRKPRNVLRSGSTPVVSCNHAYLLTLPHFWPFGAFFGVFCALWCILVKTWSFWGHLENGQLYYGGLFVGPPSKMARFPKCHTHLGPPPRDWLLKCGSPPRE